MHACPHVQINVIVSKGSKLRALTDDLTRICVFILCQGQPRAILVIGNSQARLPKCRFLGHPDLCMFRLDWWGLDDQKKDMYKR